MDPPTHISAFPLLLVAQKFTMTAGICMQSLVWLSVLFVVQPGFVLWWHFLSVPLCFSWSQLPCFSIRLVLRVPIRASPETVHPKCKAPPLTVTCIRKCASSTFLVEATPGNPHPRETPIFQLQLGHLLDSESHLPPLWLAFSFYGAHFLVASELAHLKYLYFYSYVWLII